MPNTPNKPEPKESVSLGALNARLRDMANNALEAAGGEEYLIAVAKKNPAAFLRFVTQFVQNDNTVNAQGLNIVIQQFNIGTAEPVPGVLASPVTAHISYTPDNPAPVSTGEVIDLEQVRRG